MRSGSVLIGVFDSAASTIELRGGVTGTVSIDSNQIVNIARKIDPKGKDVDKRPLIDLPALQENLEAARKSVTELDQYIVIVGENITKQKKQAADALARQAELEERVKFEEASKGSRDDLLRRKALDAKTEAETLAAGIAPLVVEQRQAEGRKLMAQKNVERIAKKIAEGRPIAPAPAKKP